MRWKQVIVAGTLACVLTPMAAADGVVSVSLDAEELLTPNNGSGGSFAGCVPVSDSSATYIAATNTYEKVYQSGAVRYIETWEESNGISGLQTTKGMACNTKADALISVVCVGRCDVGL